LASFEAPIKNIVRDQLTGFFTEKPKAEWTFKDRREADDFIRSHFVFITDDPRRTFDAESEQEATVRWICDRAGDAVVRYGIHGLVIDPWNELLQRRRNNEMRDEYTGRVIRELKRTGRELGITEMVVAHPTKGAGQAATAENRMSLYDIADGAMWFNKAEIGVVVTRGTEANNVGRGTSFIDVQKVKFHEAGVIGTSVMIFDSVLRMFCTGMPPPFDAKPFNVVPLRPE
jgi:twinkle protein